MKFICEKTQLATALSNVQKAVAQRSVIAALEGILITTKESSVEICGYNTELGITTKVPATIKTEGSVVLNAHLFTEIIKKLPSDTVEIHVNEKLSVRIVSAESDFELIGINPKEFPSLPTVSEADCLTLCSGTMRGMIRQTLFATADTDTKPIHTGTLFEIKKNNLTLVSVDGYRLALRSETIQGDLELRFVVPGKTLREVLKLLPAEDEETIKLFAGMRHIVFHIGDYCVVSRLLEGDFLDYKATIPENSKYKVTVSTDKLSESIDRVSLLITDRLKSPVRCVFSSNHLNLSCITTMGKSKDEVRCVSNISDDFEIAFNNRYMSEALRNSDCDEIEIHLNGPLSPIKILPKSGSSFLFLVLPVRVKAEQ